MIPEGFTLIGRDVSLSELLRNIGQGMRTLLVKHYMRKFRVAPRDPVLFAQEVGRHRWGIRSLPGHWCYGLHVRVVGKTLVCSAGS